MGIKSIISLQMIPWCFPLIWNHISCVHLRPDQQPTLSSSGTIKLIKSDGIVQIYHQPITASDLMTEFPKHLICHSDSFYIGQKIQALSENDKLQLGQKYFLLPNHFFQSVLSFVTIASFAAAQSSPSPSSSSSSSSRIISNCSNKNDFIKKVATCQPFDIQKTASGSLQIRVSDEFISKLMESGKIKDEQENRVLVSSTSTSTGGSAKSTMVGKVCTTPELEKDYSQLVGYVKQWKPKLETITESERRRKRFGSFAGIRNYNKKKSQIQPKGYSESGSESGLSSPYNNQMIKIKKSSSDEQYQLHHHHHQQQKPQNVTNISSPSPPLHQVKIIKTKGRKICKF